MPTILSNLAVSLGTLVEIGSRVYDVARSHGAPYNSEEFVQEVSDYLRDAIDLLPDLSSLTQEQIKTGACAVLRMIAATVEAYHRKTDVSIGANYMVPVVPTKELRARIEARRFIETGRELSDFECFLETKLAATGGPRGIPTDLVLPVERAEKSARQLFGASTAFQSQRMQLINDVRHEVGHALWEHPDQPVKNAVMEYFDNHKKNGLLSFASLPIEPPLSRPHTCDRHVMAVVNIHSNNTYLLGWYEGNRNKLRLVLEPLLHILAQHVLLLDFPPASRVNPAAQNPLN